MHNLPSGSKRALSFPSLGIPRWEDSRVFTPLLLASRKLEFSLRSKSIVRSPHFLRVHSSFSLVFRLFRSFSFHFQRKPWIALKLSKRSTNSSFATFPPVFCSIAIFDLGFDGNRRSHALERIVVVFAHRWATCNLQLSRSIERSQRSRVHASWNERVSIRKRTKTNKEPSRMTNDKWEIDDQRVCVSFFFE